MGKFIPPPEVFAEIRREEAALAAEMARRIAELESENAALRVQVKELDTIESANPWIPVEKGLPEPSGTVLWDIVFDEPRVIAGRCTRCQSRAGFEAWRGAERCNNCGSAGTRDGVQYVAGGRCG